MISSKISSAIAVLALLVVWVVFLPAIFARGGGESALESSVFVVFGFICLSIISVGAMLFNPSRRSAAGKAKEINMWRVYFVSFVVMLMMYAVKIIVIFNILT